MLYASLLTALHAYQDLARDGYVAPLSARNATLRDYLAARRARYTIH